MELELTRRQMDFVEAEADEVLFGGAAGGGKSYAQLADAFLYALRWPASRQLMLRRSFPELEKSLIREALLLYPPEVFRYNRARHTGTFANGSILDFGYCEGMADALRYQSAEYDVIRFDELTHFGEEVYLLLLSRLRGTGARPRSMKSSTNPGGPGHGWVKERFIDPAPPQKVWRAKAGLRRVFLPSLVQDNPFLLDKDPGYVQRLENLPEAERRALLLGDWDSFEGRFFPEFTREMHVVEGFALPRHWRVYRTLDYGLDMLACLWVAVDEGGRGWVFREVYRPDLIISDAAEAICQAQLAGGPQEPEPCATLAPPDLWNRRQETGKSAADIFGEHGIALTRSANARVAGWLAVKEWLKPVADAAGAVAPRLHIFAGCRNLMRTLGALQADALVPGDAALQPHELTHAPDALRGFCAWWATPAEKQRRRVHYSEWEQDLEEDFGPRQEWV